MVKYIFYLYRSALKTIVDIKNVEKMKSKTVDQLLSKYNFFSKEIAGRELFPLYISKRFFLDRFHIVKEIFQYFSPPLPCYVFFFLFRWRNWRKEVEASSLSFIFISFLSLLTNCSPPFLCYQSRFMQASNLFVKVSSSSWRRFFRRSVPSIFDVLKYGASKG